jgi:hypothetical protein
MERAPPVCRDSFTGTTAAGFTVFPQLVATGCLFCGLFSRLDRRHLSVQKRPEQDMMSCVIVRAV